MKTFRKKLYLTLMLVVAISFSMFFATAFAGCSSSKDDSKNKEPVVTACQHEWSAWTSNGDGTHTRVCKLDGSHTETANCTGITTFVATCLSDGYVDVDCPDCGYNSHTSVTKLGHSWDHALTCIEGHSCTREGCEASEIANGHEYDTRIIKVSCENNGKIVYSCKHCDFVYEEITDVATGHDYENVVWGEAKATKVNGCTTTYEESGACPTCKKTVTKTYDVTQHAYKSAITTSATCMTKGVKTLACSNCSATDTEEYEDINAHVWGEPENDGTYDVYSCTCNGCTATKKVLNHKDDVNATVNKNALAGSELELKNASIKLDNDTLEGVVGEVNISADKKSKDDIVGLDEETKTKIGENPVYDFSMSDSNGAVTSFGGKVTIRVPYTLSEGEDPDSIAIWYINDEGSVESIKAKYINGEVEFETEHFSYYTVTRLSPTERCALYGHVEKTVETKPTCTEEGYKITVCSRCGEYTKEVISALGHNFEQTGYVDAGCVENGKITYTCSHEGCNSTYDKVIKATGHHFELSDTKQSTCTEQGYNEYKCEHCNSSYKDVLALARHKYAVKVIEPTKEAEGYTLHTCEKCGYSYKDNFVKPITDEEEKPTEGEIDTTVTKIFESLLNTEFAITIDSANVNINGETYKVNNAVLKLDVDDLDNLFGYATFDVDVETYFRDGIQKLFNDNYKFGAVFKDKVLYAYAILDAEDRRFVEENGRNRSSWSYVSSDEYIKMDLRDVDFDMGEGAPFNDFDSLVEFVKQLKSIYDNNFAEAVSKVKVLFKDSYYRFFGTLLGDLFSYTETNDGYTVTCDLNKIKDLNTKLNTKSISAIINSLFGDGFYENIPTLADGILELTVGDILDALEEYGITPEGILNIVEDITGQQMDEARKELNNQIAQISNITVEEIIEQNAGGEIDESLVMIYDMLNEYGNKTVYQVLEEVVLAANSAAQKANEDAEAERVVLYDSSEESVSIYDMVNEILSQVDGFSIKISASKDKKIEGISVDGSLSEGSIKIDLTAKFDADFDCQAVIDKVNGVYNQINLEEVKQVIISNAVEAGATYDESTKTLSYITDAEESGYCCYDRLDRGDMFIEIRGKIYQTVEIYDLSKLFIENIEKDCVDTILFDATAPLYRKETTIIYGRGFDMITGREVQYSYSELVNLVGEDRLFKMGIDGEYKIEERSSNTSSIHNMYLHNIQYNTSSKTYSFYLYGNASAHEYEVEVIKEPTTCTDIGEKIYTCKHCGYSYVEYYTYGHQKAVYTFNELGDGNYQVIGKCLKCGEVTDDFERSCREYGHSYYPIKYFDLPENVIGSLYVESCLCGEYVNIRANNYTRSSYSNGDLYYFGTIEGDEYCVYIERYSDNKKEDLSNSCEEKINLRIYFNYNKQTGESDGVEEYSYSRFKHQTGYSYKLADGSESCTDGVIVVEACSYCGKILRTYVRNDHCGNIVAEKFEYLGNDTYNVIEKCDLCGETFSYEVQSCGNHSHQRFNVGSVDLPDDVDGRLYVFSCPCGMEAYISSDYCCDFDKCYVDGKDYMIYMFRKNNGDIYKVAVDEIATADENEQCKVNVVAFFYLGFTVDYENDEFSYDKVVDYSYSSYNHNTRTFIELAPGSVTCEDGVIITNMCTKCGAVVSQYEDYYHVSGITETIDLEQYGCICGTKLYVFGPCCDECHDDYSYFEFIGGCEFGCDTIYYNNGYDSLHVFSCSVTDPEKCSFRYAVKRYIDDNCNAFMQLIIGCDAEGKGGDVVYTKFDTTVHLGQWTSAECIDGKCLFEKKYICSNCGKVLDENRYYSHVDGEAVYHEKDNNCYVRYEYDCTRCGEHFTDGYYSHGEREYVKTDLGNCKARVEYICKDCGNVLNSYYIQSHDFEFTFPSCTQFGTAICRNCGYERILEPFAHEWEYDDETGLYYCTYCGLENSNGANGDIVLEDCTSLRASDDTDTIIIGYYLRNYGLYEQVYSRKYVVNVTLIDKSNSDNQILLDGVTIMEGYEGLKGNFVCVSYSEIESLTQKAGYSLEDYDFRISFVPLGSLGSNLDYAITISENRVDAYKDSVRVLDSINVTNEDYYIDNRNVGLIEIVIDSDSYVTVTSFSDMDTYGYIFDEDMCVTYEDDDGGAENNFYLKVKLSAGKYYLGVAPYHYSNFVNIPYAYTIVEA